MNEKLIEPKITQSVSAIYRIQMENGIEKAFCMVCIRAVIKTMKTFRFKDITFCGLLRF